MGCKNFILDVACCVFRVGESLCANIKRRFGGNNSQGEGDQEDIWGICLACVSDLPAGSGMGGSSVLAAAALRSLGDLLLLPPSYQPLTQADIVYLVTVVEQLLTSGGGWQDQVPN
jgi:galactokinase/mevalonate kinase-like predicted kinase